MPNNAAILTSLSFSQTVPPGKAAFHNLEAVIPAQSKIGKLCKITTKKRQKA
jgi:hypothetical protein